MLLAHRDLISPSQLVQTILCWLSGSSTDQLMLFGYAQTALNADATFEFRTHDCNKGLLPTILLCSTTTQLHKWRHVKCSYQHSSVVQVRFTCVTHGTKVQVTFIAYTWCPMLNLIQQVNTVYYVMHYSYYTLIYDTQFTIYLFLF